MVRVPAHHAPRGGSGGAAERRARPALTPSLLAHVAWSGIVIAAVSILIGLELGTPCPPGGPLALGDCATLRPFVIGVVGLAGALYVIGLSAVRWWTAGLRARGVADARAARDWYLLAAALGLGVAPMLAFTLVSALR